MRVTVEGSDNPIISEQPCHASLPPDQQRHYSLGRHPKVHSMCPARSKHSASHAAGTHGWLPPKTGWPGFRRGGVGGYNLHSLRHTNHEQAVSVWCFLTRSSASSRFWRQMLYGQPQWDKNVCIYMVFTPQSSR